MDLEKIRKEMKNYTVEEIARGSSLSRPTIMRIRDGGNFTVATLNKVVVFLKSRGFNLYKEV